ncbi:hypothetical protein ABE288_15430 [Bacillus salipaludis]|uniref:hypothetical protein n=2 Tax=Bacillales TaxID=1385 RepID=UPI003D1AAE53
MKKVICLSIFVLVHHLIKKRDLMNRMMKMAKRNRGKTISYLPSRGRGTCPLCGRTRIKLLYPHKTVENVTIKVCKMCRHK